MLKSPKHSLNLYDSAFTIFSITLWKIEFENDSVSYMVICKILALFINTLTADDKHFLCNNENLLQPIEMQLS